MSQVRGPLDATLSSVCFGLAPFFAKKALLMGIHPLYGVAIGTVTGIAVNVLFIFCTGQARGLVTMKREGIKFALLASGCNTVAILTYYWAMSLGKVALVVPITCIYPFFTMLVTYLFMRKSEVIDRWTALGTLMIIVGIILTV
jgi:uncharacterized membrane protein